MLCRGVLFMVAVQTITSNLTPNLQIKQICKTVIGPSLFKYGQCNEALSSTRTQRDTSICASDDKTYNDYRTFLLARLKTSDLQLVSLGACPDAFMDQNHQDLSKLGISEEATVCGTDVMTYKNYQQLKLRNLVREDLQILHPGPCMLQSNSDLYHIAQLRRSIGNKLKVKSPKLTSKERLTVKPRAGHYYQITISDNDDGNQPADPNRVTWSFGGPKVSTSSPPLPPLPPHTFKDVWKYNGTHWWLEWKGNVEIPGFPNTGGGAVWVGPTRFPGTPGGSKRWGPYSATSLPGGDGRVNGNYGGKEREKNEGIIYKPHNMGSLYNLDKIASSVANIAGGMYAFVKNAVVYSHSS